ncbi:MAG: hypothetical protein M3R60_14445 [Pseudomonadota bacterium]|nr:hypothetical protein [Pseudomonadota bacterium]
MPKAPQHQQRSNPRAGFGRQKTASAQALAVFLRQRRTSHIAKFSKRVYSEDAGTMACRYCQEVACFILLFTHGGVFMHEFKLKLERRYATHSRIHVDSVLD